MADDRPANDDLTAVVADLKRELDDLRSTALARMSRSATGTVEQTFRTTPLPDTLFLQGQTLNRADYPVLWQWVVDQGLTPSVFGSGNDATTFVLPDCRGRTLVGADAARAVGTKFGAQTSTLAVDNLPSHNHGGGTGSTNQQHTHPFTTDLENDRHTHGTSDGGTHVGHAWQATSVGAAAPGSTAVLFSSFSSPAANGGNHNHGLTGGQNAFHNHTGNTGAGALTTHTHTIPNQGSGTAFNTEDPGIAVNWMLWT